MSTRAKLVVAVVLGGILSMAPTAGVSALTASPTGEMTGLSLHSIACDSTTNCVGVGSGSKGGQAAVIVPSSATGKAGPNDVPGVDAGYVACPNDSACLATASASAAGVAEVLSVSTSTGALTKTAAVAVPEGWIIELEGIACASPTTCYAVGYESKSGSRTSEGVVVHLSGTGKLLGTVTESSVTEMSAIACPTTTLCIVVAESPAAGRVLQLLDNGTLGSKHAFTSKVWVAGIACDGHSVCYALAGNWPSGPGGYIPRTEWMVDVNPTTGSPGTEITLPGVFYGEDLACASPTVCVAVGSGRSDSSTKGEAITVENGKVSGAESLASDPTEGPTSIACATSSICDAVAAYGPPTHIDRISV